MNMTNTLGDITNIMNGNVGEINPEVVKGDSKEEMSPETMDFSSKLLCLYISAKVYHWNCEKNAIHWVFDDIAKLLLDLIDDYNEIDLGGYGVVNHEKYLAYIKDALNNESYLPNLDNPIQFVNSVAVEVTSFLQSLDNMQENADIVAKKNLLEDNVQKISKILYMAKFS